MKSRWFILFIVCCIAVAVGTVLVMRKSPSDAEQTNQVAVTDRTPTRVLTEAELDRDLGDIRYNPNMRKLEHEVIGPAIERMREQRELQERYEALKDQPQVIHGSISIDGNLSSVRPVRMQLTRGSRGSTVAETALTNSGNFAFDAVDPSVYSVHCFEREGNPGIRYENVVVDQGKILTPLDIAMASCTLIVHVVSEKGDAISGSQILVGKTDAPSGSNKFFFTFRNGVTDAKGQFEATRLTDGRYVVKASFGGAEIADIVELKPDARLEHTLRIRISGSQIVGNIRHHGVKEGVFYPIFLEGINAKGERVRTAVNTDVNGGFIFNYLEAGEYILRVGTTEHFAGTDCVVKVTETHQTIRAPALEVYAAEKLAAVSGTVRNISAVTAPEAFVLLKSTNGMPVSYGKVDMTSGKFSAEQKLCPGNYQAVLMAVGADGCAVKEVASQNVSVTLGETTKDVIFTLTAGE